MFYNNDNKRVNQTRKIITAAATCAWSHNEWNRNFGRSGESPHRLLDCPQFLQTNAAPLNQNGHYIKMATTSKWPLHQNGHYFKMATASKWPLLKNNHYHFQFILHWSSYGIPLHSLASDSIIKKNHKRNNEYFYESQFICYLHDERATNKLQ